MERYVASRFTFRRISIRVSYLTLLVPQSQPTFVAPEILKNIPHDQSSDLWSVGVIVYILLVGYPPFMRDTQAELFQQIRTGNWQFVEEDWDHISSEAREVVKNLLVVDPAQRWTVEQTLQSPWIQEPNLESMNRDLRTSINTLRHRRARLRGSQFSNPIYWETNDTETSPLQAGMKIQGSVDGSTSQMSYTHEKETLVHEC